MNGRTARGKYRSLVVVVEDITQAAEKRANKYAGVSVPTFIDGAS
jgi:hypothetical protein